MTRASVGDALYQAGDDVLVAGVDPVGVVDVGEARAAVGRGVGVGDMGDRAGVEVDDEGRGGEGAVQKYVVAGEDAARRHRGGWEMGERGGGRWRRDRTSSATSDRHFVEAVFALHLCDGDACDGS